jgi:glycosyltransferase involved in cell wall biosynthesis
MASPEIAVVIPTRGRETRLAFALEALAGQSLDRDRFEVIVVRDGDAQQPLAAAPEGLRSRFLTRPGASGPTAKRNLGWRATSAPLVAFTDDDCRPAPGWLAALLAAANEASDAEVLIQGRTEVDPDERHLLFGLARSQTITAPSAWYETCNIAYPRRLLERLGGFDESYSFGGEDTDLGLRALAAGARVRFAPEALVWHAVLSSSLYGTVRAVGRWQTLPLVLSRHPEQRRHLFLGLFRNRSHFGVLLAALGLLGLRRRRRLALVAAAPYVAMNIDPGNLRPRGLARQALHLPARALVDAAETASLIRNAIRHRTPIA